MIEYDKQRNRWVHIKNKIIGLWGRISDEELESTKGNISAISNLILQKYNEPKEEVASKLVDVMHAADSEDDLESEQSGIVVDTREPGSKEWDAREDVNQRIEQGRSYDS